MNVNDKNNYHNIIRMMITTENEIRNSRINWFLVIQGFLFAGLCEIFSKESICLCCDKNKYLILIIVIIGIVTSISFLFAAWRSEKAISMAMNAWNLFLEEKPAVIKDYPPICLITDSIISEKIPMKDVIGINDWIEDINRLMYPKGRECKKCWDRLINKFEWLMPYKFLPIVFIMVWSIIFWFLYFL